MKNIPVNLKIISFYRFVSISSKVKIKVKFDHYLKNKMIKGTVLLSEEGVNGFLSGNEEDVLDALKFLKK